MKLVNAELFLNINIEENKPVVLTIENPKVMAEVVGQLYELYNSGEGDFILSEDGKELPFERTTEIIINPFLNTVTTFCRRKIVLIIQRNTVF